MSLVTLCVLVQAAWNPVSAADKGKISESQILASADAFSLSHPVELQPLFRRLYIEGEHGAVLNFSLLGLAAMQTARYRLAERAFDAAIVRIESIYASDPNAARAKEFWIAEKVKDFKGEPHERAMVYFYRGLLYAREGEYDNARASFLAADRHDGLSEQETFRTDFGIMNFLAAWASSCIGDESRGEDLMKRATSAQPEIFEGIPFTTSFVGIIDSGLGPQKRAAGRHGEFLRYVSPAFPQQLSLKKVSGVQNVVASRPILAGDVTWQAMTRGGRQLDEILKDKAGRKGAYEESEAVLGNAASEASELARSSADMSMALFSVATKIASSSSGKAAQRIQSQTDTRNWSSLPADLYLVLGDLEEGAIPSLDFAYGAAERPGTTVLNARSGKCGIAWGRTENALRATASLPEPGFEEINRRDRNALFRAMLEADFAPGAEQD